MPDDLNLVLNKILGIHKESLPDIDREGNLYTARSLTLIEPPLPSAVPIHTLSGLVDLIGALKLSDVYIHIEGPTEVSVSSQDLDPASQRSEFVNCTKLSDSNAFLFGSFYSPEDFAIALQSKFVDDAGDIKSLLVLASNVKQEAVTVNEDDGFSQKISASAGVALRHATTAKPRVMLAPYRTFPEVEQPVSMFLFRAKGGSPTELPKLALFEADGGKWRNEATENIARYLRTLLPDTTTVIVS